ncbi:hypothetical protein ACFX13_029819 [Malus domestica]
MVQSQPLQQQPLSPGYGSPTSRSLPPPPWETQSIDDGSPVTGSRFSPPPLQVTTKVVVSAPGGFHPQGPQSDQVVDQMISMHPQQMYGGNQFVPYSYDQQQHPHQAYTL